MSIVGTIQPDRLADALSGGDDGMAARFLYAWPDAPHYTSLMDRRIADDDTSLAMLHKIAAIAGTPDNPRRLTFETEAMVQFDQFMETLHREAQGMDGLEAGWLGKGPGTVARLATALALLGWSEQEAHELPSVILEGFVANAIKLWNSYFRHHAVAVFNQAGRADRDRFPRKAARWIRSAKLEQVSREMIRCEALSYALDAEGTDRVIERLEHAGLLRPVPADPHKPGRPARRWAVHPAAR